MKKNVKYKNKDDVLLESIVSLLYREMSIAHLPYLHWPDRPFSKETYYADRGKCNVLIDILYGQA